MSKKWFWVYNLDIKNVSFKMTESVKKVITKEKKTSQKRVMVDSVEKVDYTPTPDQLREMKTRAASEYTLHRIKDRNVLNAPTKEEGDKIFLEKTRELWKKFAVHGLVDFNEKGKPYLKAETDLDGKGFIKILELAGFDTSDLAYVKHKKYRKGAITGDAGEEDGVVSLNGGKDLIIDHHAKGSSRDSSATKNAYDLLINMGLIEKKDYLDSFVRFVTQQDNMNFRQDEIQELYGKKGKIARTIFGLRNYLEVDDFLDLFENKKVKNHTNILSQEILRETKVKDRKTGKEITLLEASEKVERDVLGSQKAIDRMKRDGFELDSGGNRFGKVLVDVGNFKIDDTNEKEIFLQKVSLGFEMARANGYGGYVVWIPEQQRFKVYTAKPMDFEFSQGEDVRGHYWNKRGTDQEKLKVTLEEILTKICGGETEIEGELKSAMEKEHEKRGKIKEQFEQMKELTAKLLEEISPKKYNAKDYKEEFVLEAEKLYNEVVKIKKTKYESPEQKIKLLKKAERSVERFQRKVLRESSDVATDNDEKIPPEAIDKNKKTSKASKNNKKNMNPEQIQSEAMEALIKRTEDEYDDNNKPKAKVKKSELDEQGEAMESLIERTEKEYDSKNVNKTKDLENQEGENLIVEAEELEPEGKIIKMEDLEDKELIRLSNEMKKAREDYNRNKEKTISAWERIRKILPKSKFGSDSASAKESKEYFDRYKEARDKLLKYQTDKLKNTKRTLSPEQRKKESADFAKYYNEDEQSDSLDKKTGERIKFSNEEKTKEKTGKAGEKRKKNRMRYIEIIRKKAISGMLEKYKLNKNDSYNEQSGVFANQLIREVAMGEYKIWENLRDKKVSDLVDEKGKPKDKNSENIQKIERYFRNIIGESAKFKRDEVVKQWVVRIIKESLEANK